jgi:glucose-specific phosphotransferase system IIA component
MLGKGYYIEPKSNYFYCPMQGKILKISDTGHAISISNEDGIEVLVHIGIDTVELNGEGFKIEVGEGQSVYAGDIMAVVDIELIKENGYKASTAVVITNSEDIDKIKYNFGEVVAGKDDVMTFEKRKEK